MDSLPCLHTSNQAAVDAVKSFIVNLASTQPSALTLAGITPGDYDANLRSAIESLRGQMAADMRAKRRFIEAVLDYGKSRSVFTSWSFNGGANRYDYEVLMPSGKRVSIEAKGCPDGNNIQIWSRPQWANEFIIWALCPDSLKNPPGDGVWSGLGRLFNDLVDNKPDLVDAFIFWDGLCGSNGRVCPKSFGIAGLRSTATSIQSQDGTADWMPPPCVFMMPATRPNVYHNPMPSLHNVTTTEFTSELLKLFGVPTTSLNSLVHDANVEVQNAVAPKTGVERKVSVVSRCWADGNDRKVQCGWKAQRR